MREPFLYEPGRIRRLPAAIGSRAQVGGAGEWKVISTAEGPCARLGAEMFALNKPGVYNLASGGCESPEGTWLEIPSPENAAHPPAILQPTVFGESDPRGKAPAAATLLAWFDAIGSLQRSAASSPEFFREAVRLVVESAGLDGAFVLQQRHDGWQSVAENLPHPEQGFAYSELALETVAKQRVTVFNDSPVPRPAIAAPIFAGENRLWGCLYGFRAPHAKNRRRGIRPLEAQLLRLLADLLGAGLQRLEREAEGARQQVVFGQAFAPSVADVALRTPDLLRVREREVSVLFCDLRNFTSLAEKLPLQTTYEILADVMDRLTDVVLEGGGAILDYYGDGLATFWNAPLDQPDHASAACATALKMLDEIAAASQDWECLTERQLVGVAGIHTGLATIGNAGSRRRIKYGPRGSVVNLASRLEGAAKKFNLPLVISAATAERLGGRFPSYRVGKSKLAGIRDATDLFSILPGPLSPAVVRERAAYEKALTKYDAGDFEAAEDALATIPADANNTPWRFLQNAVRASRLRGLNRRAGDKQEADLTHSETSAPASVGRGVAREVKGLTPSAHS